MRKMTEGRLKYFVMLMALSASARATVLTNTDKKVTAHPDDAADVQLLYVKENVGLLQVVSSRYEITGEFLHGESALAVDYDYQRDLMFWSTSLGDIYRCPLHESRKLTFVRNVTLVHSEFKWYPASLAVDYVFGNRLYVLDTRTNTLRILDGVGGNKDGVRMMVMEVKARDFRPSQILMDPSEGLLFLLDTGEREYAGSGHILRMNMDGSQAKIIDPPSQKDVFFGPIALDWVTKNLYYTEIERRGNVSFYMLKVMSAAGDDAQRAQVSTSQLWELGRVHSLALHPNRGYLFGSVFNNIKRTFQLLRFTSNGKNITLYPPSIGRPTFLSIDYAENKLYVLDTNSSAILRTEIEGLSVSIDRVANVTRDVIRNATGFLVHDRVIYLKTLAMIYRFDKSTGQRLGEHRPFPYSRDDMTANLRVHNSRIFRADGASNPCAVDNGGCDNFCFAIPKLSGGDQLGKLCRCFDGVKCSTGQKLGRGVVDVKL